MAAHTKGDIYPNIDLSVEMMLKMKMGKDRDKDDKLRICKLSNFELNQVRYFLESLPSALINKGDTKPIILETGFSRSANGFKYDFVEGTLMQLCHTQLMDIIGDYLESTNEATIHYEVINNDEKVSIPEGTGLFMTDLKCRLLIPQDNFMDIQRLNKPEVPFAVNWENSILKISDQVTITINCEHTTHLTMLQD